MTNSIHPVNAQNPSFGSCAVLGSKNTEYFVKRTAKEGYLALEEFGKFCDKLTKWGYVKLEATPEKDVYQLIGKDNFASKITADTPLSALKEKLADWKNYNGIIDQR